MLVRRINTRTVLDVMQRLREATYDEIADELGHPVDDMDVHDRQRILQKIRDKVLKLRSQGYVFVCRIENGYEALGKPRMRKVVRIIEEE